VKESNYGKLPGMTPDTVLMDASERLAALIENQKRLLFFNSANQTPFRNISAGPNGNDN
jgi:hypothetical protein